MGNPQPAPDTSGVKPLDTVTIGPRRFDEPRRPPWAVVLLGRVQLGATIEEARCRPGSKVSPEIISRYAHLDPDWYADLMAAMDGVRMGKPVTDVDHARAVGLAEDVRRHEHAMTADAKYAHPYMRLGAEIRGSVGAGAQAQGTTIQISAGQVSIALLELSPLERQALYRARQAQAHD